MSVFFRTLVSVTASAHREVIALAFPEWCAGCSAPGGRICPACAATLVAVPRMRDVGGLRVWSGVVFEGAPAQIVRACKEDARPRLARALAPALAGALEAVARGSGDGSPLRAVPIPASARALRRRGFRLVDTVLAAAGVVPLRALHATRASADQRGLDVGERSRNVAGGFTAEGVRGLRVVIVDDVVTSGATLREAAHALRAAGATVVGAATVASTPLRRAEHASDETPG